jgi:hypothetical protein
MLTSSIVTLATIRHMLLWFSNLCGQNSWVRERVEVGRKHVSLYDGRRRYSIVGAGKWQVNDVYAEVPLWCASGPIARRWIVPTCVWKLSDCKNGSECWKIATRGPVRRII